VPYGTTGNLISKLLGLPRIRKRRSSTNVKP